MTKAAAILQKATMAALDLDQTGEVPEWIHLLPTAKGSIQTVDRRGPYAVEDAEAIIAASFADQTKLQIDENHAQDLKSAKGDPSPARGWITAMQARADGIWGKVEWTAAGRALVADKAYRAISPVVLHTRANQVMAILRASLVNVPNFKNLVSLNQEQPMDAMAQMAAALGLAEGASVEDILAAIKALKDKKPDGDAPALQAALQSAMSEIGVALGVAADAKPEAVVAAAQLAKGGKDSLVALQAQVTSLTTQLNSMQGDGKREAAERFIDKAIADRRAGVNAQNRAAMISLHQSDPATAEALVNGMPMLTTTGTVQAPPVAKDGVVSLNAAQIAACAALGISEEDYKKSLAEEAR